MAEAFERSGPRVPEICSSICSIVEEGVAMTLMLFSFERKPAGAEHGGGGEVGVVNGEGVGIAHGLDRQLPT